MALLNQLVVSKKDKTSMKTSVKLFVIMDTSREHRLTRFLAVENMVTGCLTQHLAGVRIQRLSVIQFRTSG